jgi:serine protease AprX
MTRWSSPSAASDDNGTTTAADDSLCPISSRGVTEDGFAKPDLVAPGRKILSALASGVGNDGSTLAAEFPDRVTADGHIRLSGTSMAAPMVTGAVALVLDRKPDLTPGQIKQILTGTTSRYPGQSDAARALDIKAALAAAGHPPAAKEYTPRPVNGAAPPPTGDTLLWDGARWGNSYFDGARWGSAYWNGSRWSGAQWDAPAGAAARSTAPAGGTVDSTALGGATVGSTAPAGATAAGTEPAASQHDERASGGARSRMSAQ